MGIFEKTFIIAEKDSPYTKIIISEEDGVRYMKFGNNVVQSAEYVENPSALRVDYVRYLPLGLIFNRDARRILFLGFGGGSVQRIYAKHLPETELVTVEIDAEVVRMAKKYMHFGKDAALRLIVHDGRSYIKRSEETYDMVILDAFNADSIPFHLTTMEFLQEIRSKVSEKGAVVSNLWSTDTTLYLSMIKTYERVFEYVYKFPVRERNNVIVVGCGSELSKGEIIDRALDTQKDLNFEYDFPRCAKQIDIQKLNLAGYKVITDDMVPNLWLRKKNGVSLF